MDDSYRRATQPAAEEGLPIAFGRAEVVMALKDTAERQRRADIDQIAWIAAAADAWSWIDNIDDTPSDGHGALVGERLWTFGGDGTPQASEFLTHEIGPALGISPDQAGTLIGDVLDLRHRLPLLWQATMLGAIRVWIARKIAFRTRGAGLSLDQARLLDAYLAPHVHGWTAHRILTHLDRLIIAVAPDLAEARAAAARQARYAVLGDTLDGATTMTARLDAVGAADLDATLTQLAEALTRSGCTVLDIVPHCFWSGRMQTCPRSLMTRQRNGLGG